MIQILLPLFFAFLSMFLGTYIVYFAYARSCTKKPWKIKVDPSYQPKVSILIPAHDEESTIESKLNNIRSISYPKEKIEVIVVDDASRDRTLIKVRNFVKHNPDWNIRIVRQQPRAGKSAALNKALSVSENDLVIVTDADTQWPVDILRNALPYLSDPVVGAVTGMGINLNNDQSWVTKAEDTYLRFANLSRLGESKTYSTIRFEGGFCVYKKNAFERFDCETGSDDSGTALEVVQRKYRAILVPEVIFYTQFPPNLVSRLRIKARRANQLISLWAKCFGLMLKKRLLLPKRTVVLGIMLFILNPAILLALIITTATIVALLPFSSFSLTVTIFLVGALLFVRIAFLEILFDNLILVYATMAFLFGRRYIAWERN